MTAQERVQALADRRKRAEEQEIARQADLDSRKRAVRGALAELVAVLEPLSGIRLRGERRLYLRPYAWTDASAAFGHASAVDGKDQELARVDLAFARGGGLAYVVDEEPISREAALAHLLDAIEREVDIPCQ